MTDDSLSEEQRREFIRELERRRPGPDWAEVVSRLQAAHPRLDVRGLFGGSLAGPASDDRPPVPMWEYPRYLRDNPEVSIGELTTTRVLIRTLAGAVVLSIEELMRPGPVPQSRPLDAEDVIRLYRLIHEAGAMTWDAATRSHVETKSPQAYAEVYARWRDELDAKHP